MPFEWDPSWKKSRLLHHHLRTLRGGIKWDLGQTLTGSNFRSHLLVGPRTLHSLLDRKIQVSGGSSGAASTSCQRFSVDRGRPVHLKLKWIEWHSMNVLRMVHDKVGWGCTVRLTFCPLRVGCIDRRHGLPEVAACTIQIQVEGADLDTEPSLKAAPISKPMAATLGVAKWSPNQTCTDPNCWTSLLKWDLARLSEVTLDGILIDMIVLFSCNKIYVTVSRLCF